MQTGFKKLSQRINPLVGGSTLYKKVSGGGKKPHQQA
jgi:hypothetical protein